MSTSYSATHRVARALAVAAAISAAGTAATASLAGAATHKSHTAAKSSLPSVENATNLSKEPVVKGDSARAPTKLLIKDLVLGTGSAVTSGSSVDVKYVGADYTNGKDFTSATWKSGQATSFALSTVVPGFAEGLIGMKVGGRREIVIPPSLGYGASGGGPIKPNETLVFVIDLKGVSS
jgi:FKBP-type peptidyl-prolyl cis-trans isomerase